MKKVTDLGPNECIHVRTPEEDLAIRKLMNEAGLTWAGGCSYMAATHFNTYKGLTAYYPAEGLYGSTSHVEDDGDIIHPASDFLTVRELTIQAAEKEFNIKIKRP